MADPRRPAGHPLRLAQLIETLDMGGAENLAVQIANAFASLHTSHLYVMTRPGPLSGRVDTDVHAHYLHYDRAPIGQPWHFLPSVVKGYQLLAHRIRQDGIEIIQTHLPGANFWGLLLAMRKQCKVVATVHNNAEFLYGDSDDPIRARLRRTAYRQILKRCQATVAVSEQVSRSLLQTLSLPDVAGKRLYAVPNGVTVPDPLPAHRRLAARRRHLSDPALPFLLAAGRLIEQKNFAILVTAAGILRDRGLDFQLVVVGEGPLRADLELQVMQLQLGDLVRLPGNLDNLSELMQSADLFVLPSLWEGLPLVLLEAMARALPVVGSRIHGIAEVIESGVNGVLVEPGDAQALAAALADLLPVPERRQELGQAGLATVRRDYDFQQTLARLEQLYLHLRERKPSDS